MARETSTTTATATPAARDAGAGGTTGPACRLVACFLLLCTVLPAAAGSEPDTGTTVFEHTTSDGVLQVAVTLSHTPATCARPLVMTITATTLPGCAIDLGRDPVNQEHLALEAVERSDRLSGDGRLFERSLRASWWPDLPGDAEITGRRVSATTLDGRRCSVTVPAIPIRIAALLPVGQDVPCRDISTLSPVPRATRTTTLVILVALVSLAGLLLCVLAHIGCRRLLPWRRRQQGHTDTPDVAKGAQA